MTDEDVCGILTGMHPDSSSSAPLSIDLDPAREAFCAALDAFGTAADHLDDQALLAPSRCLGWTRLDCLVHVRVGLEEMLAGSFAPAEAAADVDAASYWSTWEDAEEEDPVPGILWTRRTAGAYARPRHALEHLEMVMAGLRTRAGQLEPGRLSFQGHVITTGDFLATWAVELTIHHLDLDLPAAAPHVSPAALALARRTVQALDGSSADAADGLTDEQAVLRGFGRR